MSPTRTAPVTALATGEAAVDDAEAEVVWAPGRYLACRDTPSTDAPGPQALRLRGLALHGCARHTEGQQCLQAALVALPTGDSDERVRLLCALARSAHLMGAPDDELDWAREASEMARRLGQAEATGEAALALGSALLHCGEPQAALALLQQVLDTAPARASRRLPAMLHRAQSLHALGQFDASLASLTPALDWPEVAADASRRASVQTHLGAALLGLGRLSEARERLVDATATLIEVDRPSAAARAQLALGQVLRAQGAWDAAQGQFEELLRRIEGRGAHAMEVEAHQALSALHKAQGRFELALQHLEASVRADRARITGESERRLTALRVKAEVTEARRAALAQELKHAKLATEHAELQARNLQLAATHAQQSAQLARLSEQHLRERSAMLDVLAHEVRQPLNNASAALQGAASALRKLPDSAAAAPLRQAQAVMDQVVGAIDNTLAAAALLAGRQSMALIDTDIDMVIAMTLAEFPDVERRRIRVERLTPTRTLAMDMSLIRLALRNLLSNAIRHGATQAPVVIQLRDSDDPLALFIDVVDAGHGFPAAMLPGPFDAQRESPSGRRAGLGLYIVRRVMELHGGQVQLIRSGRDGSTVRLVLPATDSS